MGFDFSPEPLRRPRGVTRQRHDVIAPGSQRCDDFTSEVAGGAGDDYSHRRVMSAFTIIPGEDNTLLCFIEQLVTFSTMPSTRAGLTTTQLAEQTGIPAGTLRMWEARHGFPVPARAGGGHRRYPERTVASVRHMLRLREQGLSLTAAIARARASERAAPRSIFAGLRERRPELEPTVLDKRALLALSNAIEDEYLARATPGLLIGSFQRERFYRQAEHRWRELAGASQLAVAMADFEAFRQPIHAPAEVPVARDHPLTREWTLIVDSAGSQACVAAWERPASVGAPNRDRRFEVLWSFDPQVVYTGTEIAVELFESLAPAASLELPTERLEPPPPSSAELRAASALAHRVVSYLAA
jgi:DICT domain-containing protein